MEIKLTKTSAWKYEMYTSVDSLEELLELLNQFKEDTTDFVLKLDQYPIEIEIYDEYRE